MSGYIIGYRVQGTLLTPHGRTPTRTMPKDIPLQGGVYRPPYRGKPHPPRDCHTCKMLPDCTDNTKRRGLPLCEDVLVETIQGKEMVW